MKRAGIVLVLGVVGCIVQGALASLVPVYFVPDATLLATVAAAMLLGPAEGLVVAFLCGLAADTLSGALLGQHALLRMLELVAVRAVGAQLDLRRAAPLSVLVLGLSLADAAATAVLLRVFLGEVHVAFSALWTHGVRALADAICAPLAVGVARRGVERLAESEARREMRLDTRRPAL